MGLPYAKMVGGQTIADYKTFTGGYGPPFMMAGLILFALCATIYVITRFVTPSPVQRVALAVRIRVPRDSEMEVAPSNRVC